MQNLKIILCIISLCSFVSCKKDKENRPREYNAEKPMETFLGNADLTISSVVGVPPMEKGYEFVPKVKGELKKLYIKNYGSYSVSARITLWDVASKAIIMQHKYNALEPHKDHEFEIPVVTLEKDKKYILSNDMGNVINYSRPDGQNIPYPIDCGNIIVTGFYTKMFSGANPPAIFPDTELNIRFYGDYGFVFQQID